jgi:hypothetical protein
MSVSPPFILSMLILKEVQEMNYYYKKCSSCGFPTKIEQTAGNKWKAFGHLGNYEKPHSCRLAHGKVSDLANQKSVSSEKAHS